MAAVALGAALVAVAAVNLRSDPPLPPAAVTDAALRPPAPDLELPLFHRAAPLAPTGPDRLALADLRGRVVLLNVWGTWCGACIAEMPMIEQLHRESDPAQVVVLGLNSEDPDPAEVTRFMARVGATYPQLRDTTTTSARRLQMVGYPHTVIIDRRGRLAAVQAGTIRDIDQLRIPLNRVVAEG